MRKQPIRLRSGQAGFINIIVTIIITALLVGGGTYVLEKNASKELVKKAVQESSRNIQEQAQNQLEVLNKKIEALEKIATKEKNLKDEYEDWQTYKSDKYGFSFKYTEDYLVEDKGSQIIFTKGYPANLPDDMGGSNTISIEFLDNDNDLESGNRMYIWAMDGFPEEPDWQGFYNKRTESINGVEFTVFDVASGMDNVVEYFFIKDDLVLSIHNSMLGSYDKELSNKIVKTFKFLDNNTSDWNIYRNTYDPNYSGPGGQLAIDFTIWYPNGFEIRGDNLTRILGEKGKGNLLAMIDAQPANSFEYYKEHVNANASLEDFLLHYAMNSCSADGPTGSIFCKDAEIIEKGKTTKGYEFFYINMTEVAKFLENDWQEEERDRGPMYIVDINEITNNEYSFLFIYARDAGIVYDGFDDILRNMMNTLEIS